MTSHRAPPFVRLIVLAALALPLPLFAQAHIVDLTFAFIQKGAVIEGLKAVQLSDIVILRGRTNDAAKAEHTTQIAKSLGYLRVANLIVVRDDVSDDAAIEYTALRRLELEPSLEGCRFHIEVDRGVIRLTGRVKLELQTDLAVQILRRIDGVKEVNHTLTPI